jgi:hypothetical protein
MQCNIFDSRICACCRSNWYRSSASCCSVALTTAAVDVANGGPIRILYLLLVEEDIVQYMRTIIMAFIWLFISDTITYDINRRNHVLRVPLVAYIIVINIVIPFPLIVVAYAVVVVVVQQEGVHCKTFRIPAGTRLCLRIERLLHLFGRLH